MNSISMLAYVWPLLLVGLLILVLFLLQRYWAMRQAWYVSQSQYTHFFNQADQGLFLLNLDTSLSLANPALAELLGYASVDILMDHLSKVSFANLFVEQAHWFHLEQELRASSQPVSVETRVQCGDERVIWVTLHVWREVDERGRVFGFAGTMAERTDRQKTEVLLAQQQQLFESLIAIARAASEYPTLAATLKNILQVALELTHATFASLFVLDGRGQVRYKFAHPEFEKRGLQAEVESPVPKTGLVAWVIEHRQAGLILDTGTDPRWLNLPNQRSARVRSALAVPLVSDDDLFGVLTLTHLEVAHFQAHDLALMQSAADQMALAVRNAQIFEALQRNNELRLALNEMMQVVNRYKTPLGVLRMALETIVQFVGWSRTWLVTLEEDARQWTVQVASPLLAHWQGLSFPLAQDVTGRALQTRTLQTVADIRQEISPLPLADDVRAVIVAPVQSGGRVFGALGIAFTVDEPFTDHDLQLMMLLSDAIGLALNNAYLYKATEHQLQHQQIQRSHLQALIQATRDGILLISVDQRILVINQPTLDGLELPGDVVDWIDQPASKLLWHLKSLSPQLARTMITEIRRITGGDDTAREGQVRVKDRYFDWASLPVATAAEAVGRLIVLRDTTRDVLTEAMRQDLTHTMVHDLRSPISAIHTALHLLGELSQPLSRQQEITLNVAVRNIQRMLDLIDNILDVSRLETEAVPLSLQPVSMSTLIHEAADAQSTVLSRRRLQLDVFIEENLPLVMADSWLMGRVLENLLSNAIKFTPTDGRIQVAARCSNGDPNDSEAGAEPYVWVTVSDTGPGIPDSLKPRLFQKFVSGHQAESGSGLGLAFCKLVLDAHGGQIKLGHEPAFNTSLVFGLPVKSRPVRGEVELE